MSWIIFAIISAVTGSITQLLQKVLLKNEQSNPFAFGFIFQLLVAFLFLIYVTVTNTFEFPDLSSVLVNIVLMTIFYSLGSLFIFKAYKLADVSEVSVILTSSVVWSVVSAVIFLKEKLSINNILGILLIIIGIISINYTRSKWKINKGHIFALLGAMLFGLAFTNDAYIISKYSSIASYMLLAFSLPGIGIILLNPKSIKKVKYYFSLKTIGKLLLAGIFYSLSAITIFTAYKNGGQASIIVPIQKTSAILTVIFGYTYLNERKKLGNKIVGMLLTFVGALLLI